MWLPGGGGGGGGGHSGTEGGGGAPVLRISPKKGYFLRPPHVRNFVKEGYFFCTQVRSMGVKIPLQSTKYTRLWRRVTPEVTGFPSLLPPLAAAEQAEDYKILSSNTCSRSSNVSIVLYCMFIDCTLDVQNQCFDKRRGLYLLEKKSAFLLK